MELFAQHTEINILPICFILRKQSTEKQLGDLSNRIVHFKEKLHNLMINLNYLSLNEHLHFNIILYKKLRGDYT